MLYLHLLYMYSSRVPGNPYLYTFKEYMYLRSRVFHFTPFWCLQLLPLVLCCVYVKLTLWKKFEFIALNLVKRQHFEVYNGIYNGQNLWKPKFFILGTWTHSYESIFHPQIEEDHTNTFSFIKKKCNSIKKIEKIDILDFGHYNGAPL